jgi:hypothetical protein
MAVSVLVRHSRERGNPGLQDWIPGQARNNGMVAPP